MPFGLEVFSSTGVSTVSVTNRLTKLIGQQSISAPGSITITALQGNAAFATFVPSSTSFGVNCQPIITITGPTISWTYASGVNRAAGTLFYGQY